MILLLDEGKACGVGLVREFEFSLPLNRLSALEVLFRKKSGGVEDSQGSFHGRSLVVVSDADEE